MTHSIAWHCISLIASLPMTLSPPASAVPFPDHALDLLIATNSTSCTVCWDGPRLDEFREAHQFDPFVISLLSFHYDLQFTHLNFAFFLPSLSPRPLPICSSHSMRRERFFTHFFFLCKNTFRLESELKILYLTENGCHIPSCLILLSIFLGHSHSRFYPLCPYPFRLHNQLIGGIILKMDYLCMFSK